MTEENDEAYYARRAQQQLDLAEAATDASIKAIHLDLAARYATKRELVSRKQAELAGSSMMAEQRVRNQVDLSTRQVRVAVK